MSWKHKPFVFQQHLFKYQLITWVAHQSEGTAPEGHSPDRRLYGHARHSICHECRWDTWEQMDGILEIATCIVRQGQSGQPFYMAKGQGRVLKESPREGSNSPENRSHMPGHRQVDGQETQSLFLEWFLLSNYGSGRRGGWARGNDQAVLAAPGRAPGSQSRMVGTPHCWEKIPEERT